MQVRSENSYFTAHVIASEDKTLFISINPSDPQRLSVLGSGAQIVFALSQSTSCEEAEQLSRLINELSRQIVIIVDSTHPLYLSPNALAPYH